MEQFIFSLGIVLFIFYIYAILKKARGCDDLETLYNDYIGRDSDLYYCEELGRTGDITAWKSYAKSLTSSKPMHYDIDLMSKPQFIYEMYIIYNLTLKEI